MCFSLDTRPQIDNRLLGILFCAEGRHCVFFLFFKRGVGSKCLRHCNFCLNEEWTSALGQDSKAWEWNGIVTLHHRNSWCSMIKGVIYPKMKFLLSYAATCHFRQFFCFLYITKGNIVQNVHAAFCHTMKWKKGTFNLLFTKLSNRICIRTNDFKPLFVIFGFYQLVTTFTVWRRAAWT